MENTLKLRHEKFCCALSAFDSAYSEFDSITEAFENEGVRLLYELAFSAYLEWKNYVDNEQPI